METRGNCGSLFLEVALLTLLKSVPVQTEHQASLQPRVTVEEVIHFKKLICIQNI